MDAFLSSKQRLEVGFTNIIEQLEVTSSFGIDYLVKMKPFNSKEELILEFDKIATTKISISKNKESFKKAQVFFARFKNIDSIIDNLGLVCLDEVEIFEIKKFIYNVAQLSECFSDLEGMIKEFKFYDFSELFDYLDPDKTNKPFFNISNKFDDRLSELRKELNGTKHNEVIEKIRTIEYRIRVEITDYIKQYRDEIKASIKQIAYLDVLIAKAKLALKYELDKPSISEKIVLEQAYNPYIRDVVLSKGYEYTKLDINVEDNIQLITGSNMSGKSVTLKTIVLNALCFHYGIFPFALKASFPVLDYVIYLSDELQDVENSLSTFGKEVVLLNDILDFIEDKKGLLVIDELARGTNPMEAKMIVVGLCKYLNKKDVYTVLATHLDLDLSIDFIHYQVVGLSNVEQDSLSKDDILKVMDYSLVRVDQNTKVPNDAFKVMNFLKLNKELKEIIEIEYEKEREHGAN